MQSLINECNSFKDDELMQYSDLMSQLESLYQSITEGQRSPSRSIADKRSLSMDLLGQRSNSDSSTGQRSFSIDIVGQRSLSAEEGGQSVLSEALTLHARLANKWGSFDSYFKQYSTALDLSLKFHEILFEVSLYLQCIMYACV